MIPRNTARPFTSDILYVKCIRVNKIPETVFCNHKYLTNPTVTHAVKVVDAARVLCHALISKKKQRMHNSTLETLKKLSDSFPIITKISKDNS